MKRNISLLAIALLFTLMTICSSCAAIAGIFKAGVWTGIFLVVIVVVIIIVIISRISKKQ